MGTTRWSVDSGLTPWAVKGEAEEGRCLPAWTRLREVVGREVRRERRVLMCEREMSTGTVRGMTGGRVSGFLEEGGEGVGLLSPLRFLMKICIVSEGSGEAELERERDTMLSAGRVVRGDLVVMVWFVVVLSVVADVCRLVDLFMGSRCQVARTNVFSNRLSW